MMIIPTPPSAFVERLRAIDPNLILKWSQSHGVWSVWCLYEDGSGDYPVMNVIEDDGSYRPLDERTIKILLKNRYYAEHQDELIADVVDKVEEDRKKQEAFVHDEFKHISKDKTLKKQFDKMKDLASSVPKEEWAKPKVLVDVHGKPYRNEQGEPLTYVPHQSWKE